MTAVPAATPVTIPDVNPIVAIEPSELCHVPPVTLFVSVLDAPAQIFVAPPIEPGALVILTVIVALQPVDKV